MQMKWIGSLCLVAAIAACESKPTASSLRRAQLNKLSGNVIEIVPEENQPPWCLVYTISEHQKIIRQLTMGRENRSFACPAGKPVGGLSFRIPADEGAVRVYAIFSDQRLNAGSIAQQLYDLSSRPVFNVLDLRAPGRIVSEHFDFIPEEEAPVATGALIAAGGQLQADAGEPPAPADGGAP